MNKEIIPKLIQPKMSFNFPNNENNIWDKDINLHFYFLLKVQREILLDKLNKTGNVVWSIPEPKLIKYV